VPESRLPRRFLIRGSLLIVVALSLWWFVLLPSLLGLLRLSADVAFNILPVSYAPSYSVNSSGDWDFQIPLDGEIGIQSRTLRFTVPKDTLINFTFSLPIYWALLLAIPAGKREMAARIRALLFGSAVMVCVEIASFVAAIEIAASDVMAQVKPGTNGFFVWAKSLVDYLALHVIPFLTPFVIAGVFDRSLRRSVFTGHLLKISATERHGPARRRNAV
jgi:hypothetical protein